VNLANVSFCSKCGEIFTLTWNDQVNCNTCERIKCDPEKIELYRSVGRNVWKAVYAC